MRSLASMLLGAMLAPFLLPSCFTARLWHARERAGVAASSQEGRLRLAPPTAATPAVLVPGRLVAQQWRVDSGGGGSAWLELTPVAGAPECAATLARVAVGDLVAAEFAITLPPGIGGLSELHLRAYSLDATALGPVECVAQCQARWIATASASGQDAPCLVRTMESWHEGSIPTLVVIALTPFTLVTDIVTMPLQASMGLADELFPSFPSR